EAAEAGALEREGGDRDAEDRPSLRQGAHAAPQGARLDARRDRRGHRAEAERHAAGRGRSHARAHLRYVTATPPRDRDKTPRAGAAAETTRAAGSSPAPEPSVRCTAPSVLRWQSAGSWRPSGMSPSP